MQADTYTPGYSSPMVSFMAQRTADTHATFFLPHLKPGWRLLDAGCGPGTITLGLARKVAPGHVIGIDVEDSQFAASREEAQRQDLNVEFRKAIVYELPFEDQSFDAVFSHALLEHLSDPAVAIAEFCRVLKPEERSVCDQGPGRPPDRRRLRWPGSGILGIHGEAEGRLKGFERRPETGQALAKVRLHRRPDDRFLRGNQRSAHEAWTRSGPAVCGSRQLLQGRRPARRQLAFRGALLV